MSENYLDGSSLLPRRVGEIYSDRNIKIVGQARYWSSTNKVETLGVRLYCTPTGGGSNSVSILPDGMYDLAGGFASASAALSVGSPCVASVTNHGRNEGDLVYFQTTGVLPSGVTAGVRYYVRNPGINTFNLSLTMGGTLINTTASPAQSGVHTLYYQTAGLMGDASIWLKINRSITPLTLSGSDILQAQTTQPTPRENFVQAFYRDPFNNVVTLGSSLIGSQPQWTRIGIAPLVFAAIVGDDSGSTHTDLQQAINDVTSGSWILVKKMVTVVSQINTNSKVIKLHFVGIGTGLTGPTSANGIRFDQPGCQMVGFGEVKNFTGIGVDLNNQQNCKLEMLFNNNTTHISYGTLKSNQVNVQGCYGLTENSTIEASTADGTMSRWDDTYKRWRPGSANLSPAGLLTIAGGTITLNKGGASGGTYGIDIEEASAITSYIRASADRQSFNIKAPANTSIATLTPTPNGGLLGMVPLGAIVPIGNAQAWSIPSSGQVKDGFALCNGQTFASLGAGNYNANFTSTMPSLLDNRFLMGSNTIGLSGGLNSYSLVASNIPRLSTGYTPAGSVGVSLAGGSPYLTGSTTFSGANHTHTEGDMSAAIGAIQGRIDYLGYQAVANNPRGPTVNAAYAIGGAWGSNTSYGWNHYTKVYGITAGNNYNAAVGIAGGYYYISGTSFTGTAATITVGTVTVTPLENRPLYFSCSFVMRVK